MRRSAKPAKAKVEAKLPVRHKGSKNRGARVRDLETRLADSLKREAESLGQQAATAEILRVIGRSQTDLQPVFDTIAQSAVRLCGGVQGNVVRFDGNLVHRVAGFNLDPEGEEALRHYFPRALGRDLAITRAMLDGSIVHLPDTLQDADHLRELAQATRARAVLAVPMLRDGQPIGAISVVRREPRPFSDSQIALLQTFADQAVLAIENVRLFNETKEALEQQTAAGEILQAISRSPTNLQAVLDTIARNAALVCSALDATVQLRDGELLRIVAHSGPIPTIVPVTRVLAQTSATGRAILDRKPVHIRDIEAPEANEFDSYRDAARQVGFRALIAVPMLREGVAIGRRQEGPP